MNREPMCTGSLTESIAEICIIVIKIQSWLVLNIQHGKLMLQVQSIQWIEEYTLNGISHSWKKKGVYEYQTLHFNSVRS